MNNQNRARPTKISILSEKKAEIQASSRKQFLLFLVVGGFAALVNLATRVVFSIWMNFSAAIVAAYLCGMLTAFALNRTIVFRGARNAIHHQIFWFTVINILAAAQTLIVSLSLAKWAFPSLNFHWHPEIIAHAVGVAVPVLTSFAGHKHLSFTKKSENESALM